jgi:hypothetical protein
MRHFWNAAVALDPAAYDLDEGRRFPICKPEPLKGLFQAAGLKNVKVCAIDISTELDPSEVLRHSEFIPLAESPAFLSPSLLQI